MVPLRRALTLALVFFVTLPGFARANGDDVPVTVTPWAGPSIERFDPEKPPDPPPKELGDAQPEVRINGGTFKFTIAPDSKITIIEVNGGTVTGSTRIRLPEDAGPEPTPEETALKEHELGHDALNADEYARSARKKVQAALRGFKGMTFQGEGTTLEEKFADAKEKMKAEHNRRSARALRAILSQMKGLNDEFDMLTDHGRGNGDGLTLGPDGEILPVTTEIGIGMIKASLEFAPEAGEASLVPALRPPFAAASGVALGFASATGLITLDGLISFDTAFDPLDPILSGTRLSGGPFLAIGPQPNGTILLADSTLTVFDEATGDPVLDGFLFELAYRPAAGPAFAGVIQGFLDVPPAFAGGIDPAFGSSFLDDLLRAAAANERTMFWLFTDVFPFDEVGSLLSGSGSGRLVIASSVDEPNLAGVVLLGVAGLGIAAFRRRRLGRVPPLGALH